MTQLVADTSGHGPAVVLLHGQPGSRGDWAEVTRRLEEHFLVVAPDRPGYGQTGGRARGLRGNAAAVVSLLDRLGVAQATIVGYSWAGGVALALAQEAPERVAGLVLVSSVSPAERVSRVDRMLAMPPIGTAVTVAGLLLASSALSIPPVRRALHRRQGYTTATCVVDANASDGTDADRRDSPAASVVGTLATGVVETIASSLAAGPGAGDQDSDPGSDRAPDGNDRAGLGSGDADRRAVSARAQGPKGGGGSVDGAGPVTVLNSWRSNRVWRSFVTEQRSLIDELPLLAPGLAAIDVPTVVLVGEADRIVPPAAGRGLARTISGARLIEVGGAGHLLAYQHPDAVAAAIRDVTPR